MSVDEEPTVEIMTSREHEERERVIMLIAQGVPPNLAAFEVGWSPRKAKLVLSDPDFIEMVDAAINRGLDTVETALHRLALKGNLGAIKMVLYNRRPEDWKDVKYIQARTETTVNIGEVRSAKQAVLELLRDQPIDLLQQVLEAEVLDGDDEGR